MQTGAIAIDRVQVTEILTALQDRRHHRLEELVDLCPDQTRQQVETALDFLIKSGQICMALDAEGTYWVWG
ncbi:hypothetical protein YTPLAS72_00540 [Nitrospira sp.]|nr:hypothetical protein YTPLAS72_00540 [Nitrospira sp.]